MQLRTGGLWITAVLIPLSGSGATLTWTGGGDNGLWSDPTNWDAGRAPVEGDALTFSSGSGAMTNDITDLRVQKVEFFYGAGSYVLDGEPLAVNLVEVWAPVPAPDIRLPLRYPEGGAVVGPARVRELDASGHSFGIEGPVEVMGRVNAGIEMTLQGAITLSGANDYDALNTWRTAHVTIDDGRAFGSGLIHVANNSVIATSEASITVPNSIRIGWPGHLRVESVGEIHLAGAISGDGHLRHVGPGTLALSGDSTFLNGLQLMDGTVEVRSDTALGVGWLQLSGGTLRGGEKEGAARRHITLANAIVARGNFALDNAIGGSLNFAGEVDLDWDTIEIEARGDHTITGIVHNGGIIKTGQGILTLAANNTFAGGVTVSEGTLGIGHDRALGTGPLVVADGAGLRVSGDVVIDNAATFDAAASFSGDPNVASTADPVLFPAEDDEFDHYGTLVLTAPITLAGDFVATVEHHGAVAFTGGVSGAAALIKDGDGVLALHGDNTYTGYTIVRRGVLYLAGSTATSGWILEDGGRVQLAPGISISGDITIDGGGFQAIEGGVTIENDLVLAGDLVIGGRGELTLSGAIDLGGAVRGVGVSHDGRTRITRPLGGSGGIEKRGPGTLILEADNTYTGGTRVHAGVLELRGAVVGDTAVLGPNANLVLAEGGALGSTLAIGLGGGVTVEGGSPVVPASVAVQLSDLARFHSSMTFEGPGDLENMASAWVEPGSIVTFSDGLSGPGSLAKDGGGELRLLGDQTYAGNTVVSVGTLRLNGSTASSVEMDGGTLAGNATIGNDLLARDGRVAPGNSVGTIVVAGNFNLGSSSTLEVEVDASTSPIANDVVDVGGVATLDASSTIEVVQLGATPIPNGHTATIITTVGGVADSGAAVIDASAFFDVSGAVVGDNYVLTFVSLAAFQDLARERNNIAIGAALDADLLAGENDALLAELQSFGEEQYNRALSEISPQAFQAAVLAQRDTVRQFHNVFAGEMLTVQTGGAAGAEATGDSLWRGSLASAAADPVALSAAIAGLQRADLPRAQPHEWAVFARVFGVTTDVERGANRSGFGADTGGVVAGVGRAFTAHGTGGLLVGYSHTEVQFAEGRGEGEVNSLRIGPHASYRRAYANGNSSFLDAAVTLGYHDNEFDRELSALRDTANSEYEAYDGTAYVGAGFVWHVTERTAITPVGSMQYTCYRQEGFTEEGSSANLVVDDETFHSLRSALGVRLTHVVELGGVELAPEVGAMWSHEFLDDDQEFSARFENGVTSFDVTAEGVGRNTAIVGAGISARFSERASAFVRYDAALGGESESHALAGGVALRF